MSEKILLFDLDGTLVDSTDAIVESFVETMDGYGIDVRGREGEIEGKIGATLGDMFLHFGIKSEEIKECIEIYRANYRKVFLEKTHLLPKVKEPILNLQGVCQMAVVTSKSRIFSEQILEKLGLLQCFFKVVGIEDVREPKPSAEPILKALEGLEWSGDRVFMIGDTSFDMLAAKNAGVNGIGVSGRYQKDLERYTQSVFANMEDALAYIMMQL